MFIVLLACILPAYAASVKNAAAYASLNEAAVNLPWSDSYQIVNVATGKSLQYTPGFNFYPQSGDGDMLTLLPHNASTAWMRLSPTGVNKCLSAQWDYTYCSGQGCDNAGVLYACQVDPAVAGSTLTPAKQWWIFVPLGTSPQSYNIPTDHLKDMATKGMHSCTRSVPGGWSATCLDVLDQTDDSYAWNLLLDGEYVNMGPSPASSTSALTPITLAQTSSTSPVAQTSSTILAPVVNSSTAATTTTAQPSPTAVAPQLTAAATTLTGQTTSCGVSTLTKTKTVSTTVYAKTKTQTVYKTVYAKSKSKFENPKHEDDGKWIPIKGKLVKLGDEINFGESDQDIVEAPSFWSLSRFVRPGTKKPWK